MKQPLNDIHETFGYLVKQIRERHSDLAYIHAVESRIAGNADVPEDKAETLDFLVSSLSSFALLSVSVRRARR